MFSALWNAASSMWATERESSEVSRTNNFPLRSQSVSTPMLAPPSRVPGLPWQESVGDAGFSDELSLQWTGSANNKLFVQLLDDLDDLSSNSPSAHRRRRARDIFSEWLFSADLRSPADGPGGLRRDHPFRRSAADFGPVLRTDEQQKCDEKVRRRCSGDFSSVNVTHQQESPQHRILTRRSLDDRRHSEPLNVLLSESEPDPGYHTGSGGVRNVSSSRYTPSERTLTRDDLRRRITTFNNNNHGLIMEPPSDDRVTFQGSIRVLMNLIRPISMCISVQPPTLHDVTVEHDSSNDDMSVTSFYLPKDTTKLIHISSITTSQEVIKVLLSKYHIMDNPRKFALYEKTSLPGHTVKLRRISDDEMPLQLCLSWTDDGVISLDHYQFVLQENDTGEILWEAFSLPELESFLTILNREEEEYIDQVKSKYRVIQIHMKKRLQSLEAKAEHSSSAKRTPVFV